MTIGAKCEVVVNDGFDGQVIREHGGVYRRGQGKTPGMLASELVKHRFLAARAHGADNTRVCPERIDQGRHADPWSSGITLSTRGR